MIPSQRRRTVPSRRAKNKQKKKTKLVAAQTSHNSRRTIGTTFFVVFLSGGLVALPFLIQYVIHNVGGKGVRLCRPANAAGRLRSQLSVKNDDVRPFKKKKKKIPC